MRYVQHSLGVSKHCAPLTHTCLCSPAAATSNALSFQEVLSMFKFGHRALSAPVFADGKNAEEQSHISTSGITKGD